MANGVFNVAKGRVNELHNRVEDDDPTQAVLVLVLLKEAESDGALIDRNNLDDLLNQSGNEESEAPGYSRIIISGSGVVRTIIDDDANERRADLADQTFPSLGPGADIEKLLICFDFNSTTGNDTNVVPMTHHDFVTQLNGSDIIAQISSAGYFIAGS